MDNNLVRIEDALDCCLNITKTEEQEIEICLERFPEHKEELKKLLDTVSILYMATEIIPGEGYKSISNSRMIKYFLAKNREHNISRTLVKFLKILFPFYPGLDSFITNNK